MFFIVLATCLFKTNGDVQQSEGEGLIENNRIDIHSEHQQMNSNDTKDKRPDEFPDDDNEDEDDEYSDDNLHDSVLSLGKRHKVHDAPGWGRRRRH